jgi:hypothetical protein
MKKHEVIGFGLLLFISLFLVGIGIWTFFFNPELSISSSFGFSITPITLIAMGLLLFLGDLVRRLWKPKGASIELFKKTEFMLLLPFLAFIASAIIIGDFLMVLFFVMAAVPIFFISRKIRLMFEKKRQQKLESKPCQLCRNDL